MKNLTLCILTSMLLSGTLSAQTLEGLRKSSEKMSVDVSGLKRAAKEDRTAIAPGRAGTGTGLKQSASVSTGTINPFEGLAKAITALLKLIFAPNGDVEIATEMPQAPEVEGTLQDDGGSEETYDAAASYQPLDPAEYAPASAPAPRADINVFSPGSASAGGGKVPEDLKRKAVEFFNANASRIGNKRYIGIVDFSAHSSKARFYIIDMQTGSERAIHVAHGRGSDLDGDGYANKFSNQPNSRASSLGFYVTGALYSGSHGRSMRLNGLSSTNSNALSRAVVVHESDYVQEANMTQGRSFGCLAVAKSEIRGVLASLNGGALIYAGLSNSDF